MLHPLKEKRRTESKKASEKNARKDSSSASNIQHNLVLEQVLVPPHRVAVTQRADLVLEHLLVDPEVGVRVGVVVGGSGGFL
jgi:hypothetical protein